MILIDGHNAVFRTNTFPDGDMPAATQKLTERIRAQILDYLKSLSELGAFTNDRFVVQCDAGVALHEDPLRHGVTILLVFHPIGSSIPVSFTIHQTVSGCRVTSTAFAPVAEDCA